MRRRSLHLQGPPPPPAPCSELGSGRAIRQAESPLPDWDEKQGWRRRNRTGREREGCGNTRVLRVVHREPAGSASGTLKSAHCSRDREKLPRSSGTEEKKKPFSKKQVRAGGSALTSTTGFAFRGSWKKAEGLAFRGHLIIVAAATRFLLVSCWFLVSSSLFCFIPQLVKAFFVLYSALTCSCSYPKRYPEVVISGHGCDNSCTTESHQRPS